MIAIVVRENGSDTYYYTYTDHLGSILTVTNSSGGVIAEQSFDAWGRYRDVNTWVATTTAPAGGVWTWLTRGYTSHEHLRPFALINMNGRLYDPALGRVLSPDNYIQDPFFTQNYNRYSYAYNNPMVYNDPDGQWLNLVIGAALGGFSGWKIGQAQGATGLRMLGYIYAGAAIGTLTAGLGSSIVASFSYAAQSGVSMGGAILAYGTAGAASGLVGGASFAFLSGGNVWEGMWKGALFGGIGGGVSGFSQHLAFENSLFDTDLMLAGKKRQKTYFGGTLDEVIVRPKEEILEYTMKPLKLSNGAIKPSYFFEELFIGGAITKPIGAMFGALFGGASKGGMNTVTRSESTLGHIFRDATGHVNPKTLTSQNRYIKLFESVGNNPSNINSNVLSTFQRNAGEFQGYSQIFRNGKQVWVQTRNGKIINAGVNTISK